MEQIFNIDKEKKLIELLGLDIVGPDENNRWTVIDKENRPVGYIQYKLVSKPKKRNKAIFGYETKIDTDKVRYRGIKKPSILGNDWDDVFNYELDIKNGGQNPEHLEFTLFEGFVDLSWHSKKYGLVYLTVNDRSLNFSFPINFSKDRKKEMTLSYQWSAEPQLGNPNTYTCGIVEQTLMGECLNATCVTLEEKSSMGEEPYVIEKKTDFKDNEFFVNKRNTIHCSLEQAVSEHYRNGIEYFGQLRDLLNRELPFENEIIESLLSEDLIEERGLGIFVPDLVDKKDLSMKPEDNKNPIV